MKSKKQQQSKREIAEKWLLENKDILKVLPLEKRLNIPKDSISKFLKKGKSLNEEKVDKINLMIKEMIYHYEKAESRRDYVEYWLIEYKDVLNIKSIEQKFNFPKDLIHKFLSKNKRVSDNWINLVNKLIENMLFDNKE